MSDKRTQDTAGKSRDDDRSGNGSEVASAVRGAARDVLSTAGDRIGDAAEQRKNAAADRLMRVADAAHRAADELGEDVPLVPDYVHLGAERLETLAEDVRERGVGELAGAARRFARRRPAAVAGAAALVGFAAVRFLTAASPDDEYDDYEDGDYEYDDDRDFDDDRARDSLPRSAFADDEMSSGDPGGEHPTAPGFATSDGGKQYDHEGGKSTGTGGNEKGGNEKGRKSASDEGTGNTSGPRLSATTSSGASGSTGGASKDGTSKDDTSDKTAGKAGGSSPASGGDASKDAADKGS